MTRRIPEGTLIIVADGGSARVFTNVGNEHQLALKQEGELRLQDISERPGRPWRRGAEGYVHLAAQ